VIDGVAEVQAPTEKIKRPRMTMAEVTISDRELRYGHLLSITSGMPAIPIAVAHPCDAESLRGPIQAAEAGLVIPVLVGPEAKIRAVAEEEGIDLRDFRIVDVPHSHASAETAVALARDGVVEALMKGSLHTDELMAAIVDRTHGLRGNMRISHAFVFDLPRYPKLLALADCVVNIAPSLRAKQDILSNALELLHALGIEGPKVGIVAAVETVNPAIPATLDAQALVALSRQGQWPGATVEGPLGFDNAISAEAARIKGIASSVAGDADLLLVPDLNAGNMLYKSFNYIGGGERAGLVLGARVPVVLTSRADSALARLASVALAVLAMPAMP
jgi:phosphate acetyltransferase